MTDKPGHNVSVSSSASSSISHGPIDPSGAKAASPPSARAEVTTVGVPIEYKVVDLPWQPSDPASTEAMLTEQGQDGWRLTAVYPDPVREKSRWIFVR